MSMKKKSLALVLSGLMLFSSAFTGYSVDADASTDTYITDADLADNATAAPTADAVVPDANQYRYQKEELAAFCHFGPNTFNEIEWGENYGDSAPSEIFTLTQDFDAETLVSTLKGAGFEKLVVTAKHHDGFCIWDSEWTEYDVAASGYQDAEGNSDILAEISAACTEYDMDMGLYLSPWDIHDDSYGYYDADGNATDEAGDVLDYNEYYNNQLIEILSQDDKYGNNGHFTEVWMDGAKGSGSDAQEYDFVTWFNTIQQYEGKDAVRTDGTSYGYDADCMLFGAQAYTTVHWIGNEDGYAGDETWAKSVSNKENNTVDLNYTNGDSGFARGYVNGNQWTVPESDARITSGWFWGTQKCTPKSIEDLASMYFGSVGHNSVLLLNVPPNNQGTVDQAILNRVTEFGNEIRATFETNLAEGATVSASEVRGSDIAYKPSNVIDGDDATYWTTEDGTTEGSMIIDLGSIETFDVVSIEEAIQFGQRITSYTVEYSTDGTTWSTLEEGPTIGAKRLCRTSPVKAQYVKITVATDDTDVQTSTSTDALTVTAGVPMISEIGVYKASEAFEVVGAAPVGMTVLDERDDAFAFTGTWNDGSGSGFIIDQTERWANSGNSFTVTFTGSKIYLIGTIDPSHGTADISIDGGTATSINTTGTSRQLGQVIYESGDLTDGEHTLTLTATGTIGVDGAYVINNGGLGMIGIEESAYTMNEDSEMEVKLIRVGGTTTEDVTVTLSPNPGSAIQDDYDTELIETVTFAAGETEKTARVRTTRNTNTTGDRYFTVELTSSNADLILGFNSKARITITDTESISEGDRVYTADYRFQFPDAGVTKTLEAESMELVNSGTGEAWPLQISENSWASNGKFVNAMNSGDSSILYYTAPRTGTYTATVTYRSGDSNNGFTWTEATGKIANGEVTMGASDGAAATHTGTITFEVVTAGDGVLTFAANSSNAPQLDKFEIVAAELDPLEFTVTKTAGENGTITGPDTVEEGASAEFTITPNEGYVIADVTVNGSSVGAVETYTVANVSADITIEATFVEETPTTDITDVFTDVAEEAWYVPYVQYVYENDIMTGSEGLFLPGGAVTRAMVAETLYKMEGRPAVTDYTEYEQLTDLSRDNWWADSVAWALNTDVATGDTYNMVFNPEASVTREQLATFLYRYANMKGIDTTVSEDAVMNDSRVSAFALEAFTWAVDAELISGIATTDEAGNVYYDLAPQSGATRAELAAVLTRFYE